MYLLTIDHDLDASYLTPPPTRRHRREHHHPVSTMAFAAVHHYWMVSSSLCITLLLSSIATETVAWTTLSTHHPSRVGLSKPTPTTSTSLQSTTESSSPSNTAIIDETYYSPSTSSSIQNAVAVDHSSSSTSQGSQSSSTKITLTRWLSAKVQDYPELRDMESLHLSIQMACKTISNLIHSSHGTTTSTKLNNNNNLRDDSMKRLDQLSKNVLQNALRFTGRLRVVEAPRTNPEKFNNEEGVSEHQPGVTIAYALDQYGKVRMCVYVYIHILYIFYI